ncbi:hypothetical protein FRX31_002664 [Thalictrum thalictroides]|uniref:DUF3741 domain-containing protein n=1 Tax=Thalictrum thalictroides TaxID=46969 RepID=A0A7J6XD75_THATH|nr:hypothetical protein FRX31_002664 [Thalictrum thalictroides]
MMKASVSPGIVARLMGQVSMPEPNFMPKARNPDDVIRRSSAENVCERGIRSKERKTEIGNNREVKQKRTDRSQNKLNRRDVVVVKKEKQVCSKTVSHQKDSRGKLVTARPTQTAAASRKIKHISSVPTVKKKECVYLSRDQMPSEQANRTRFLNREKFIKKDKDRSSHCRMEIIKPKPHLPGLFSYTYIHT